MTKAEVAARARRRVENEQRQMNEEVEVKKKSVDMSG